MVTHHNYLMSSGTVTNTVKFEQKVAKIRPMFHWLNLVVQPSGLKVKVKVNVNFTLEQATKAQRGS